MKDERSIIKDQTITNLRAELNEQYIADADKIADLTKKLEESKNMQNLYESERNSTGMRKTYHKTR